jgi:hypothetical protein
MKLTGKMSTEGGIQSLLIKTKKNSAILNCNIVQSVKKITATNLADAIGSGADVARIPPAGLEPAGVGALEGQSHRGRERNAGGILAAKEVKSGARAKSCNIDHSVNKNK